MNPLKIPGPWREGYVLDYHTSGSTFLGHDQYGHPIFDTKRTETGELLYRLKYRQDLDVVDSLADLAAEFVRKWSPAIDVIVPVPPTRSRRFQPVIVLAAALGQRLGLPVLDGSVRNTKNTRELKNVFDYSERIGLLEGAHKVAGKSLDGKSPLLFDDLYRSGATLNAVTRLLYDQGRCIDVCVLALTRTRSSS